MSIREELGLPKEIRHRDHEAVLNIVFTSNMLQKEALHLFAPMGITDAQFNVLIYLYWQYDQGAINQTELGNMLLVHRSNVTGLVDRLEKAGLVRRIPSEHDRRVKNIELTRQGAEIAKKAQSLYLSRIEEIMSGCSTEDIDTLCRILETVRSNMK
jgi:DNA-binding MarR family transcriptional regulator